MRRDLIKQSYPRLSADQVDLLARNTAGFTAAEVLQATEAFQATGKTPSKLYRYGDLAISANGMAMERLFHPYRFARQIDGYGFRARAYGYWGGAGGSSYVRAANRMLKALSRLTMPSALAFRIVAQRL